MPSTESVVIALRSELERRRAGNRSYSLRAFAASLGVDHGTLSRILSGTREPRARTRSRLWARLRPDRDARMVLAWIDGGGGADSRRCADALKLDVDRVDAALAALLADGEIRMEGERWVRLSSSGRS